MRICHPLIRPEIARVDALFLDSNYPIWRRQMGLPPAEHPGVDYNLAGSAGDQDEGYPVVAMADGMIRSARAHRVWGNVVLIEHPELAQRLGMAYLASQYAHLKFICVTEGQQIWAGEPIGSIGKGDPARPFAAHLHFEIRKRALPPDNWPGMNRAAITEGYLDPQRWLQQYLAPEHRFTRQGLVLWLPTGKRSVPGEVVINLEDPTLVHVRITSAL